MTPTLASQSLISTIVAEARISPKDRLALSSLNAGRIADIRVNAGDTVVEGELLIALDTTILEAAVVQAESALTVARTQRDAAPSSASQSALDTLDEAITQAQAVLDAALSTRDQAYLYAPFDGTVIEIAFDEGENVSPTTIAITIADLTQWQAETIDLQEEDAARIFIGQNAWVEVPSLDDTLEGVVTELALSAVNYQGSVTYQAVVDLQDADNVALRWGMTAYITIELNRPLQLVITPDAPTENPIIATATPDLTSPDLASPAPGTTQQLTYVVRAGDSLFQIAQRYDTSVSELIRVNGLSNSNLIHPGLELIVPDQP